MPRTSTRVWIAFLTLSLAWGTSYLWIKIGLGSLPPLTLIAGRLIFGATFLAVVVAIARQELPRSPRTYGHLLVMSIVSIVIPFTLITVSEQSIDSALASILNATVPLGVIVIAPFFLPDERITAARVVGLAVGFAGVILLVAPGLVNLGDSNWTGELLMLGSSLSYAVGGVYARRNVRGMRPMIPALFQVTFAAVIVVVLALLVDRPFELVRPAPEAIVAVLWLGIIGSGIAYLCQFFVLEHWGATRASMVTYVIPVIGIALGSLVLDEPITLNRIAGTVLVVVGVALVNAGPALLRLGARFVGRTQPDTVEAVEAAEAR
jgi:drug/metabolite transporter (DMT)-like permease